MLPFKQLIRPILLNNTKVNQFLRSFSKIYPDYDVKYLTNQDNLQEIQKNINIRKGVGNIQLVHEIHQKLNNSSISDSERDTLKVSLQDELRKIPNKTHPGVLDYGIEPKEISLFNAPREFDFEPKSFADLSKYYNILRMEHLSNFTGHKSYYLMSDLADLGQALIQYTVDHLRKYNFNIISVPDILPENIIESCGMTTTGERTQVYRLIPSNLCLSGTSEMALAGFFSNKKVPKSKLPIRLCAVSRCFRAETSGLQEEKGIYRVHQFTKVEMFSVCAKTESTNILEEFKNIEIELFRNLGLHFKLLDMPPCELGAPAYRKYDIEAWLPGRKMWGEISSCSDCTDYQSRRLNIRDETNEHVHTVNGTACAVPRMLIAILENFQNSDYSVTIPEALKKYLKFDRIVKRKIIPELKLVKHIPREK